jgi:hypothetical protein
MHVVGDDRVDGVDVATVWFSPVDAWRASTGG